MKTIGTQDQVSRIVERDTTAMTNLKALANHNRTFVHVTTTTGEIKLGVDPVIFANVQAAIVARALRRFYKLGRRT